MGSKIITAFLLAVIGSAWMLQQDAEKYEAFDSVPREFCGEYVKIFTDEPGDISPGELGVEFFSIEENQVGILGRDRERRYYDVQQVHRLSDRDAIIFYGEPNEDYISQHRRQISFRENHLLDVGELFAIGNDDKYSRLGTYQLVRDYASLLNGKN